MPNLRPKIFWNFFLYQNALDSEIFWGRGCVRTPTFFWSCHNWGQKIFRIFSFTKHSVLWIWVSKRHQLFFGHAKFDVNNFSEFFPLLSTLDWMSRYQLFFGHVKFEVKKFLEFLPLPNALDSEISWEGGSVWTPTCFGHAKFEVKKFSEFFPL